MAIFFDNVSKSFDQKHVLRGFNATFQENSITCIMGESGSGKTTLLNLVAGLLSPDSGSISGIDGQKIAFVFQEDRLCESFTVYRNLRLICKSLKKEQAEKALLNVGLEPSLLREKVNTLSGGMKRRIAILRALFYANGGILLLDEPTKGLDKENRDAVISFIKAYATGCTVLWVTHDIQEAQSVTSNVLCLK